MRRQGTAFILLSLLLLPVLAGGGETERIRKIGKAPNFIALGPDGTKLYATSYATDELLEVDLEKRIVTRRMDAGGAPLGLALADGGKTALVACMDSGTVAMIDLDSFQVLADVPAGARPNSVAVGARGYNAYVVDYGRSRNGRLHVLDLRQRRMVGSVGLGVSPFGIAVSPTTERVFVLMGGDNAVWVVHPAGPAGTAERPGGAGPARHAPPPLGQRLFVANSRSHDLSIIDAELLRVLVTVPIGKMPFGVAVSPDGKRVFVINAQSRTVSVLPADLSSLSGRTFDIDKGSTDILVAPDNRTVYVVSEATNSVLIADVPADAP